MSKTNCWPNSFNTSIPMISTHSFIPFTPTVEYCFDSSIYPSVYNGKFPFSILFLTICLLALLIFAQISIYFFKFSKKTSLLPLALIASLGKLIEQTPRDPILLLPLPKLLKYSDFFSLRSLQQEDNVELSPQYIFINPNSLFWFATNPRNFSSLILFSLSMLKHAVVTGKVIGVLFISSFIIVKNNVCSFPMILISG